MKYLFILGLTILSFACAQTLKKNSHFVSELTISPGEVRWLEFPLPNREAKLLCRGVEVKFVKNGDHGQTFIMESYFSDLTPYLCQIEGEGKIYTKIKVTVTERSYLAEKLKVDPKKIKLAAQDEKRVYEEQLVLNKIYNSSHHEFLFFDSFKQPMESVVTSVYGTKRVYNKEKKGQHLGIDYRAAIGDKVPATNSGKIVYSGDLFYTGWTVIIDHGLDIFSVYGHLSKTLVNEGDLVKRGDLIGLSGNTGRTSGPHLHWGVKVQGQYIDGLVLIEESKKYFKK
jgi:murein DD-endopeptidase MepM/ murein hydrolase activator NlpD